MGLPLFDATSDPGPSFFHFAEREGYAPAGAGGSADSAHATTVVAVRYADGVVMVADRQATAGYVASRDVRKIEAADRFTGMAISGSAARGMELLRLAQLSFEHYEKMTDSALTLTGKANYLSPIVQRNNLLTPLPVIPLLAGWDVSTQQGRVFEYDGAGGCYERQDFATIGSGTPFAEGTLRLGWRPDLSLDDALNLGCLALYEAGDNDPATGGPDFVRQIFPMVAVIDRGGFRELPVDDVAQRFRAISERRSESGGVAGGALR